MRISDWSSDVCSSDLAYAVRSGDGGEGNQLFSHGASALGLFLGGFSAFSRSGVDRAFGRSLSGNAFVGRLFLGGSLRSGFLGRSFGDDFLGWSFFLGRSVGGGVCSFLGFGSLGNPGFGAFHRLFTRLQIGRDNV